MSIKQHRYRLQYSNKRLRRARRLYYFLCRHAWKSNPNATMAAMQIQCYDRGLRYQPPGRVTKSTTRDWRYSICRAMFKLEAENYSDSFGWSRWLNDNNITTENFQRVEKAA